MKIEENKWIEEDKNRDEGKKLEEDKWAEKDKKREEGNEIEESKKMDVWWQYGMKSAWLDHTWKIEEIKTLRIWLTTESEKERDRKMRERETER